ncbi:MAG TPA: ATP-dependent 6-phosphofructokinase [Syntrophales bacterium]|nr:ATP-dependent 6-phosphofructokinase [Syntrophales bacterium]HOH72678.1 ATP-dependent 6-phosphofructokinase [Syntrophales bacterium]HPN08025.1 ATP-dependent 6-phosphofructokinase [Syntrophales bacterium]HPX81978.1 ATP-dependent 6-phosphofructokinase [Syntrophales bacterium]HQB14225.1 ATP-dependent 6-phosphofructokinase [Syntrophales bacterium]
MMTTSDLNFEIPALGSATIPSPITVSYFTPDDRRIIYDNDLRHLSSHPWDLQPPLSIEVAGPRRMIYFDPPKTKAAIVTCGGLCPGINDVIRAIVMELYHRYAVQNIVGIKYGFQGLIPAFGHEVIELSPELVKDVHAVGGSILSSSRGKQDIGEIVNVLKRMNIDIFFCIGGDGTMRATELITEEIARRKLDISVIGIPKTIDNDLNLVDKTFGFDTAISEAVQAIRSAHVEAKGAPMGIGLVKLMGRQSGHIAVHAALAQNDANFVLIPEVPFDLHGERGFLKALEERLRSRLHCVILVAEGAGQEFFFREDDTIETDASGNLKLFDIGLYLKCAIEGHFKNDGLPVNVKYIDPSYMIRSVPANAGDSIYCGALGQYAVHAGMSGKTGMLVGLFRGEYVHLPLRAVMSGKKVDPTGNIWMRVIESTGQPLVMKNEG